MSIRLTGLNIYPIKSARGIPLDASPVDEFGLRYDRRWMVVDESGVFLSQRSHPRLALVAPALRDGTLEVTAPGMPQLELPLHPSQTVTTQVRVWDDVCLATWLGEPAAHWFSEFLGTGCSLVYMAETVIRPADPTFAPPPARVSFADGFPFLIISQESLADLNGRLSHPLPMNRFRPNLVVAGGEAFAEDSWKNSVVTRTPFALASSATPPQGSTPRCRMPVSATVLSMTPSLHPSSTMNGSDPVSSVSMNVRAVVSKCLRITDEPDE